MSENNKLHVRDMMRWCGKNGHTLREYAQGELSNVRSDQAEIKQIAERVAKDFDSPFDPKDIALYLDIEETGDKVRLNGKQLRFLVGEGRLPAALGVAHAVSTFEERWNVDVRLDADDLKRADKWLESFAREDLKGPKAAIKPGAGGVSFSKPVGPGAEPTREGSAPMKVRRTIAKWLDQVVLKDVDVLRTKIEVALAKLMDAWCKRRWHQPSTTSRLCRPSAR